MKGEMHIPDEDLAALAEGGLAEPRRGEVRAHLTRCRRCLAAYVEAVRFRARELIGPGLPPASADALRRGLAVADPDPTRQSKRGGLVRLRPVLRHPGTLAGLAGLAAAAVVAVVLVARFGHGGTEPALDQALLMGLRAAVERASAHEMIIPGGEFFSTGLPLSDRNGARRGGEQAAAAIAVLEVKRDAGRLGPKDGAWLVAGLTAAGRTAEARASLQRLEAAHPGDLHLQHLAAVLAYLDGDLVSAESLLRELLAEAPDDVLVAFNLGYLLDAQGRAAEGRPLLEGVVAREPDTPLAERAAKILRCRD